MVPAPDEEVETTRNWSQETPADGLGWVVRACLARAMFVLLARLIPDREPGEYDEWEYKNETNP